MPLPRAEKSFCITGDAATKLGVAVETVQFWVESSLRQVWETAGGHSRVMRESVKGLPHKNSDALSIEPSAMASAELRLRIMVKKDNLNLLSLLYKFWIARWPLDTGLTRIDIANNTLFHNGRGYPDLLISDLRMPGMDGFGMLEMLHNAKVMTHTTVVVVTDPALKDGRACCGTPPEIEILAKPVPFDRLFDITQLVARSSSRGLVQQTH